MFHSCTFHTWSVTARPFQISFAFVYFICLITSHATMCHAHSHTTLEHKQPKYHISHLVMWLMRSFGSELHAISRGGNRAGRIGFGFRWFGSGRVSLIKKICQVTGHVQVDSVRLGSGFRSNTIGFFGSRVISDWAGSGFGFL
jgi:hypothetical protein